MQAATLHRLLLSICFALGCIGVGAAAWWAADAQLKHTRVEYTEVQKERLEADSRLAHLSIEGAEIDQRVARYRNLVTRGVVGEEQRLEWAEALQRLIADHAGMEIRYTLSAQRALDYRGLAADDNAPLRMSQIRLEAQLLHEGEFFRLLGDLQDRLPAHVSIRSCDLGRKEARGGQGNGNLVATCVVDLITIRATSAGRAL